MKRNMVAVRSGGELVDTVSVETFESTQEAFGYLGEAECLGLINAQHLANVTNAARAKHRVEKEKELKKALNTPEVIAALKAAGIKL